jgi:hypothetical protein
MIEVQNINGSPEFIPNNIFGQHFNGQTFIFFETEQEKNDFYDSLNTFSLDVHKQEIEKAVDELIDNTYTALWYSSKGDISIVALDIDSRWHQEAVQLTKWINNIYAILEDYKDSVTEENYQDPQEFINNLPIFNG